MKRINSILVFLFPIAIVLFTFFSLRIMPFGSNSIWYIDLPAQIIMFYSHLYDVFQGQESIFFTWNYGMGTNFWATFCYYLSSPLSFLILFFPRDLIPQVVIMIYLIKLGLSSLFMSFLLKKLFNINGIKLIIFSGSYALMSFSITYYFLPMWIDAIYLLPLLILSVHLILENNQYKLFLFTLTILFISNFYISYMTGIFVFLYFVKEIYTGNFSKKENIKKFKLFFSSVFLAASFSMVIILPTYLQIKNNNYSNINYELKKFSLNPLDIYQKFFIGTTELQNLSLYIGLIAVMLVPLYFFNKKYSLKERISDLILLSFMLISVANNFLIYFWHVFEIPNGAFFRFTFLISFYLIILSVKSLIALDRKMLPLLMKIYAFNFIWLCLLNKLLSQDFFGLTKMYVNIFILTALFFILILKMEDIRFKIPRLINFLLLGIVILDLSFNSFFTFRNYIGASSSLEKIYDTTYQNVVDHIGKADKGLYRISPENELLSTENESLKYRYKGMSIYSSTGNGDLNVFLGSLGYPYSTRNVNMKNGIFVSDTFFGFNYYISLNPKDNRIYEKVYEKESINAYKNKYSLPIGFLINKEQFTALKEKTNWMDKQNAMLGSYKGDSSYYKIYSAKINKINNLKFDSETKMYKKIDQEGSASLEYSGRLGNLQQLYLQLNNEDYNNVDQTYSILINGKKLTSAKMGLLDSLDLGTFEGEEVNIKIEFINAQSLNQPEFYTLNYTLLGERINEIKQNTFHIQEYNDKSIIGKIDVKDAKVLFLSIPYDKNWQIVVDGKQIESIKLGEFLGIPLNKGSHELDLRYIPKEINGSILFSSVMLVLYIGYVFVFERKRNKYK